MGFGIPDTPGGGAGAGGSDLIMPETSFLYSELRIKTATGTVAGLNNAAAYTAFDLDHSTEAYDSFYIVADADTSLQEVVDLSGSGLVTHLVAPGLGSSGVITIILEVDGVEETYFTALDLNELYCIGDFNLHIPSGTGLFVGAGGTSDVGYQQDQDGHMTTPIQTALGGRIGIKFESSFNFKIQGSVPISGTLRANRAVIALANYIPVGR